MGEARRSGAKRAGARNSALGGAGSSRSAGRGAMAGAASPPAGRRLARCQIQTAIAASTRLARPAAAPTRSAAFRPDCGLPISRGAAAARPPGREGQPLNLVREPDNPHVGSAVRLDWQGHKLGYVPRPENAEIARRLDAGERLTANVANIDRQAEPWERVALVIQAMPN